jgi:hypothetical protein
MREFKFRAWNGVQMMKTFVIGSLDGSVWGWDPHIQGYTEPVKRHHVLMQFTGLHDKNGKAIYEGDVLHFPKNKDVRAFVVQWDDKKTGYTNWHPRSEVAVIGNIYENPELLA